MWPSASTTGDFCIRVTPAGLRARCGVSVTGRDARPTDKAANKSSIRQLPFFAKANTEPRGFHCYGASAGDSDRNVGIRLVTTISRHGGLPMLKIVYCITKLPNL